ncbi:sensor histidine kinase [Paenibacillus eucommiae]|uniref:Sensor histidine kinase YesM n=1 Tax=Paenibacillus eucommiae TaxID=1355755 RepID=A0ABS4ISA4_9BACL|nr:histidine kinase [Paenibacillus eucommiae]MBP1990403.1 sensor histidine kinase YesM [Paenibacillus eucommiae]
MNVHVPHRFRIKLQSLLIALSLTLAGTALFITAVVFYSDAQVLISEKMDAIHKADFNQIDAEILDFYESTGKITALLQNNIQLIDILQELEYEDRDLFRKSELVDEVNRYLMNLTINNKAIKGINIVTRAAQYYSGHLLFNGQIADQFMARQISGIEFVYPEQFIDSEFPLDQGTLLNSRKLDMERESYYITSLRSDDKYYGNVIVILQNLPLINKLDKKDDIMIVDDRGYTIYRGKSFSHVDVGSLNESDPVGRGEVIRVGKVVESRIIYAQMNQFNGWKVYYSIENKAYSNQITLLFALAISFFLICFILSFLFSKFIARRIARPIANLTSYMKRYKVGDAAAARSTDLNRPKQMPLREKIYYYFLVSILAPVCGFVLMFHLMSSSMLSKQILMDYKMVFEDTVESMNDFMEKKERLLLGQAYSNLMQRYLQGDAQSEASIYDMMKQYMYLGMDGTFSLYNTSNQLLLSSRYWQEQQMDSKDFSTLQKTRQKIVWSTGKDQLGADIAKLSLTITDLLHLKPIGYAQIEIQMDEITKLYSKLSLARGSVFLFDENNMADGSSEWKDLLVVRMNETGGVKPISWQGTTYYMFYQKLGSTSFYLVSLYNKQDIVKQSSAVLMNNIYLLIVLFLTLLILSFSISWALLSPVNKINSSLYIAELGQFTKMPSKPYVIDEVYELSDNFNQLLERIEGLVDNLLVVSKKKHEAENNKNIADIRALQAQINPHFLQNTLDNIIYMMQEQHTANAIKMIQSLSRLFRYGISRGETIIPLHEEIKYAKAYVSIMEMRYGDGIRFTWNIEEAVLLCHIPKLILQPLIENAIHHGFRDYQGEGTISITCEQNDEQILITVADDGKGISKEALEVLQNRLLIGEMGESMGILNVHERIRLSFGAQFGVTLHSERDTYTQVTLNVPKLFKEQD